MRIEVHEKAIVDFEYWKKSRNKSVQKKIEQLILAIQENPFMGIGKPEQLKYDLSGQWSRRINEELRIIYDATNDTLNIFFKRTLFKNSQV